MALYSTQFTTVIFYDKYVSQIYAEQYVSRRLLAASGLLTVDCSSSAVLLALSCLHFYEPCSHWAKIYLSKWKVKF